MVMGFKNQPGRWRRRRRHDILLDGCCVLAGLISSICSSIFQRGCLCNSRCQRVGPISEDSDTEEIPLDDFGLIDPVTNQPSPASQVLSTHNVPNSDDQLVDYEVTRSSSCEPLNSSLDSSSSTAFTTEHSHDGPNQSSPASQMLPIDHEAAGDERLLNSKVVDSSSCKPFSSSLGSTTEYLTGTNTVDVHELVSHPRPASEKPLIDNEANTNNQFFSFKTSQFVGDMGAFVSGHDPTNIDSSACEYLPLSSDFLSTDPTGTTTMDSLKLQNLSQMDPDGNEANGNE